MIKSLNSKQLAIFFGGCTALLIGIAVSNFYTVVIEGDAVQQQLTLYSEQNVLLKQKLLQPNGKVNKNTDLNYYINNIYAYALLEEFQVQIKTGETKFRNTIQLIIEFQEFKDKEKFKSFLKALSNLGFLENITSKSLTLNVFEFSLGKAKQIIDDVENLEKRESK